MRKDNLRGTTPQFFRTSDTRKKPWSALKEKEADKDGPVILLARFIHALFTKFPEIRAARYQDTYHTRRDERNGGEPRGGSQSANAYVHAVSTCMRACTAENHTHRGRR